MKTLFSLVYTKNNETFLHKFKSTAVHTVDIAWVDRFLSMAQTKNGLLFPQL